MDTRPDEQEFDPVIEYRTGFKHQLNKDKTYQTRILGYPMKLAFLTLNELGLLTIHWGYAWDGASGPAIDNDTMIAASLPHDGIYQLLRHGLPPEYRAEADRIFKEVYLAAAAIKRPDGWAGWFYDRGAVVRANYSYWVVNRAAQSAADPKNAKPVLTAP